MGQKFERCALLRVFRKKLMRCASGGEGTADENGEVDNLENSGAYIVCYNINNSSYNGIYIKT